MVRPTQSRVRGFTLIEAMVTIAIVVILAAVAVPSFRQLTASQRIKTASFDLFSALNYARSEAIKRNGNVTLNAVAGDWSTGWRILDGSSNVLRSWGSIPSLTVSNTATGNATVLTFGPDGRMTPAPKLQVAPTAAIAGVSARCIQMSLSGRPTTTTGACP